MLQLVVAVLATVCTVSSAFVVPSVHKPRTTRLFAVSEKSVDQKIPVHLLAGFLGSGKTTTLQHLLENTEGTKIGIVVNDVASVNIDAKLVSKTSKDGIVELQNGCACCSLAGEFVNSVDTLINSRDFDLVVVELSGVADPVAVQNTWRDAVRDNHAVTNKATLKNVVTVVDACTFGTDYLTWDFVRDRSGWAEDDCSGNLKVTELLAEQVEAADLIVVNKLDLANEDQVKVATKMASSLNDKAILIKTEHGKVAPAAILKDYERVGTEPCDDPDCIDSSHSHSHDHVCDEPDCTDSSHSYSHDHAACDDPDCTDTSHSHSHDHAAACDDPDCTDTSHSHSHDHTGACDDPDCTDISHSHSHSHATSTDALGISNFVYKAKKPFDARKLQTLLLSWPIPIKDVLDLETLVQEKDADNDKDSPFEGVLRSKGFCWMAPTSWDGILADPWRHDTAMYWSHAGKHMGIQQAGRWWASVDDETMKDFFSDNPAEYQRIRQEDFVSEEFGDRRQELVFIGVDLDQESITKALDDCLLSEKEMDDYRKRVAELQEQMNAIPSQ